MRARKGERKRQFLDQARALAAARGFGALTPATLAESMDLTTAQVRCRKRHWIRPAACSPG
jgi:hypothetical protein